jgi:hypothetical protein
VIAITLEIGKGIAVGAGECFGPDSEDKEMGSLESHEARTGTPVRVKEGYRKTDLVGIRGTVRKCWGHPDYAAVDIELEDGRSELLWFHELEVDERAMPSAQTGSHVGS